MDKKILKQVNNRTYKHIDKSGKNSPTMTTTKQKVEAIQKVMKKHK